MLTRLAKSALDLIFPIHCCGCGREGGILCGECSRTLERLRPPLCRVCAAPGVDGICRWCLEEPKGFDCLRALYPFRGPIRDAIHSLKYRNVRAAAGSLGDLMAGYLQDNSIEVDVLVPVPLHPKRLRSRGYNQSALLAARIGRGVALPVREDLLSRVHNRSPQVESRSREERRANVIGSFAPQGDVQGLRILLIDDVATTGSTLSECASILKESGASRVYALTLAREA